MAVTEREYRRLLQQIEDDYQRKKAAVELVWQMSAGMTGQPEGSSDEPKDTSRRGSIDSLVRHIVPQQRGVFSLRDVFQQVKEAAPSKVNRSAVSAVLKRMAEEGEVIVVSVGRGQRGSTYRVKSSPITAKVAPPPIPGHTTDDDDVPFEEVPEVMVLDVDDLDEHDDGPDVDPDEVPFDEVPFDEVDE